MINTLLISITDTTYNPAVWKRYYQKHREEKISKARRYYQTHKNEVLDRAKNRYCDNRDKMIEQARVYRETHPDECRVRVRKYQKTDAYKQSYRKTGKYRISIGPHIAGRPARRIYLGYNPRTGACSDCGVPGLTHMHHDLGYFAILPWFGLKELCLKCHRLADHHRKKILLDRV